MLSAARLLKRIHILGTAWFLVCAAALLIVSLRQAGVSWWLVFSISGYSVVIMAFLLAFYLFALFRGVVRAQFVNEHPLSTSPAYLFFYDAAPFFGALAGLLCSIGYSEPAAMLRMVTEGTLVLTFLTWVVIDSLVGLVESMLPQSVYHRTRRLAAARAEKKRIERENAALLESIDRREADLRRQWETALAADAVELAALYCSPQSCPQSIRQRTVEAGAKAWRLGKISCMRFLHKRILQEMKGCAKGHCVDYATYLWEGIGSWRGPRKASRPCVPV
jgi:hypothetical protein